MKRFIILLTVLLLSIGVATIWWKNGSRPKDQTDKSSQIFVVAKGEGVREIANSLKTKGLIKDPIVFFLQTKRLGLDKDLEAGDFRLSPSMSLYDIVQNLTHGTLDTWITIPEGLRADEIADILKAKVPTYKETWRAQLDNNEGYLFPDTYLIPRDADITMVINMLRNNFNSKYKTLNTSNTNLSQDELVTTASLIEREARRDEDRRLVASVITNRLGIGMKLDIDATIQYALGYSPDEKRWWKKSLTGGDKLLNSSYNTYRVSGLPPTPISNPGLESLKAAINPADTSYLYYITDKNGINRYAATIEVHNANIKKYGL